MLSCKNDDTTYALSPALNRMVHISVVKRGLSCNCVCPGCDEPMVANQGEHNSHYFSHERKAGVQHDLQQCYMSAMHRLAEQILLEKKMVMVPSYYKFFEARRILFDKVEIEERRDRADMQPDIVGVTRDGKRYLIEILFSHAIDEDKRKKIYADNLTCVEIDISKQRMDDLEDFLLNQDTQRKWINNKYDFEAILESPRFEGKNIRLIPASECIAETDGDFCPALAINQGGVRTISNCGKSYIICQRFRENCILEESASEKEDNETETAEIRSYTQKHYHSSSKHVYIPKSRLCEKGDERTYPCHPGFLFTTLEDYYKRIKPGVVFSRKNDTQFEVLNYFCSQAKFAVVLAAIGSASFTFCVVVVSKEDVFEYRWYYPFDDEIKATFAAQELLEQR